LVINVKKVIQKIGHFFRQLRWQLTLSYTTVTVGALIAAILIAGFIFFSSFLIPTSFFSPEVFIESANRTALPILEQALIQDPVDLDFINAWAVDSAEYNAIISQPVFQISESIFFIKTTAEIELYVLDKNGFLLGTSNPTLSNPSMLGKPLYTGFIPGLETVLKAALSGTHNPDDLVAEIEADNKYVMAIPIYSDVAEENQLAGILIGYFSSLPTIKDISTRTFGLMLRSLLLFLFSAGLLGAIFGSLTADGLAKRFERLAEITKAWRTGNFSEHINDPTGDEISQFAQQLDIMAIQLEALLQKRQEMAVTEERNRLARDLHDSTKQQALAASFQLGTALALMDEDPINAKIHLLEAEQLVDTVRTELNDLIHELRPHEDQSQTFIEMLTDYAVDWAHQNAIVIDLDLQNHIDLPLESKQTLYRITQEALANVSRHSGAKHANINLHDDNNSKIFLEISDDGCGFEPSSPNTGLGLQSMRERTQALNGNLRIESKPGKGTRIQVEFSYPKEVSK
jgi:signal transduction histidine kinase